MFRNKFISSSINEERVERKPTPVETVVHRWEVTYTCSAGDEAQPPLCPVVVYSRLGGSDADTPRPALHIAVESADASVKLEPEVDAVTLGKRPRSPSPIAMPRSAQANAASGASYATAPHTQGNDPALRREIGTHKSRGRPPKRQHDVDRRRSASPPHRLSDGTRPAKRAEDMASWKPKLRTRKIRGCDESTEWSESHSEHSIRAVPDALLQHERGQDTPLSLGHLHLHVHKRGVQTWMLVSGTATVRRERDSGWASAGNAPKGVRSANPEPLRVRRWIPATIGTKHLCLQGYVLHFLDSGEPGFVLEASARNYAAGRKERKRRKSIAQTA